MKRAAILILLALAGCSSGGDGRCTGAQRDRALVEAQQEIEIIGALVPDSREKILNKAFDRICKGVEK